MDLWFSEYHTDNVRFSIRIKEQLACIKSDFQEIAVFDTYEFGKILVLDGFLMVTERDEFIYHEMITHVPMAVNPAIKKVLVIGAGDGGVLRELSKYPGIESIDVSEIDREVVSICEEHLPKTACGFEDARVNIFFEDGLKFIRRRQYYYDLIIVDSTDPFGPGEGLFTKEFYGNCYNALNDSGILVNQHESPFYTKDAETLSKMHSKIKTLFPVTTVYQAHIPTYPSGHWLFGFASKTFQPMFNEEWRKLDIQTQYYNEKLHYGSFALPNYVLDMLK